MGNSCACYSSSEQAVISPPQSPAASISSLDSIIQRIRDVDAIEQIDPLIGFIEKQLNTMKASSIASTSSSYHPDIDQVESVASRTTLAAQIIDWFSNEAERLQKSEIANVMGSTALKTVKAVGELHWVFVGLSMAAYAVERYIQVKSNEGECKELLDKIGELARDLKKFREAMPAESDKLWKAVNVIAEGAVMCCDFLAKGNASRYWSATTLEKQLQKTKESIRDITPSLTLTAVTHIARKLTRRSDPLPRNLLEFQPVGIDKQVSEVKELLDMEGDEQAVAVILCGFGGVGKTTLAASVIEQLDLSSSNFKFCRVIIDEKTPDETSHVVELQKNIILDFGGDKMDLRNPADGRNQIQNVMENKCCFLFIDNVVNSDCIKQLLPTDLLPHKQNTDLLPHKQSMEKTDSVKQKVRILITSRTSNPRAHLKIKKVEEYAVKALSNEAANLLLRKTILQDENELFDKFDEAGLMNDVAEACKGVPLLLSVFGSQLSLKREEDMYNEALQALQKGDLDSFADEEHLGQKLLFVYHKMNEEAQEAFLDICVYFHGRMDWNSLRHTVGEKILDNLHSRMLVTRSESGYVIVHDILRLMGRKEAKDTRFTDYKDLSQVLEDESKLKSVRGIELNSETSLTTLESRHLNAMHDYLRVLILGNWVKLDGPPCDKAFKNLRFLGVGDLSVFPFKDASKLEKLSYFYNKSKAGMNLSQLPPALKYLSQDVPSFDCDALEKLQLQNLKVLEFFSVIALKAVKLPEGLKLPASLKWLVLSNCKQVPERFDHLSALVSLTLDKCDIDVLPQGFGKLAKLSSLSMEFCTKLTSVSEGFGSFSSLTYLSLRGCTRLEELPADLAALTALKQLNVGECENLKALPNGLGGLSSLQKLNLTGCISLQRLPDSFGTLGIKSLNLHSLQSLQELPQNIGNLPCLLDFTLISCNSLASLPDSFVELEMLETLTIKSCIKLADLPNDFGRLRSLKKMTVEDCFSMKELPHGFQALPNLEILTLRSMSSLLHLPAGFWELACLEKLILNGLLLSSLPPGFGKLKRLKELLIYLCPKLETLPDDFENLVSLRKAQFASCYVLEGAAMESIVKLQQCYVVYIHYSSELIEQWKEMQQKEEHCAMVVVNSSPSRTLDMSDQEWQRAAKVNLFRGQCVEVNSTKNELIMHPSMSIDKDTTVALIGLPICIPLHHQLLQRYVGMAMERSRTASSGQLRMIYARKDELVGQRAIDEAESIREVLMLLPQGCSYAIPSADTRRLSVINYLFFNSSADDEVVCFMADIKVDDKGHQIFVDAKIINQDDISRKIVQDEVKEILPDIREDIKCIYEKRKREEEEGGQSSHLQKESMESTFAQVMKKSQIHHFIDSKKNTVTIDQLQGKTVGLIMCGLNTPECVKLQQIYEELKLKDNDFEWIWIPLSVKEYYGFGAYNRAIESMPWKVLPNPKLVNIKDKSACFIVFDKGGEIVNQDVLSLVMSWGARAYPFTQIKINEISSNMHNNSSLELLLEGMDFYNPQGVKVEKEQIYKKLTFLYAEPPSDKLIMKSMLDKLAQAYEDFAILYVGYFCSEEQQDVEALETMYENAEHTMYWPKLSFWDMIMFWHRCKYWSNEDGEKLNLGLTINRIVKNLYSEKRWLVFMDRDEVVTANGKEVVEMMCKSIDGNTSKVSIVVDGLIENLKSGRCTQIVKTFFADELSNYPHHPQHHLLLRYKKGYPYCDVCFSEVVAGPDQKRIYTCEDCDWDLCGDCWEVFANEKLKFT